MAAHFHETTADDAVQTLSERRLVNQLDAIGLHNAQLPRLDEGSTDEVLGYDEHGLPG
jgi:hypothetical protein